MRLASLGIVAILIGACGGDPADTPDAGGTCGNGVLDPGEDCDFGTQNVEGGGCEPTCTFGCPMGGTTCDDGNACNGAETCTEVVVGDQVGYHCANGAAPDSGTDCGSGMICVGGACSAPTCGDGVTTSPEECDDGDQLSGNGCESDCTFSCVSTDSTRNCAPADACAGQGTCNDASHTCASGTALPDDTLCGTGGYCMTGVCTQPVCGNSDIEPGEQCDNGPSNPTPGDGCDASCDYECEVPASDCGTAPACQMWQCSAGHACQAIPNASLDGSSCGGGMVCNGGNCVSPTAVCGNGVTEPGEQCDFGGQNGPGTGCESNCAFSCTVTPNSCTDGNLCDGTETCDTVTVSGHTGQRCSNGTPPSVGTSCGVNQICLAQTCSTSTCGDGYVHAGAGETCEPPNTASCDAACHAIATCGDGIRSSPEQCDDGNTINMDGCHSTCKFEQTQRVVTMTVDGGTDAMICPANALGTAAGSIALGQINDAITLGIADGAISVMYHLLGLDDNTGVNDASLQLGMISGVPVSGTGYNGASDLDWWYTTDATTINASRVPTTLMSTSIAANRLETVPAAFSITVQFVGVPITMSMVSTKIRATTGTVNAPTTSAGTTPGHVANEHLDPALTAFSRMTSGSICGETIAQSLANVQIAATVLQYCSQYNSANTLLDLFVGGCYYLGFIKVIGATQPDGATTTNDVYRFQTNASTRQVNACTKNGASAPLNECLSNATYTTLYRFTSDRVIAK